MLLVVHKFMMRVCLSLLNALNKPALSAHDVHEQMVQPCTGYVSWLGNHGLVQWTTCITLSSMSFLLHPSPCGFSLCGGLISLFPPIMSAALRSNNKLYYTFRGILFMSRLLAFLD